VRVQASDNRTSGVSVSFQYRIIGLGDDTVRPFAGGHQSSFGTSSGSGAGSALATPGAL
jgi:hypothetical protein